MAFSTKVLIPYLEGVLASIPTIQHIQRGEPVSPPARVNAYIILGGQQPNRVATGGLYRRVGRYIILFAIRVVGEEDETEDILADLIDAVQLAVLADPTAGGLTSELTIDAAAADNPEYRRLYGPEFRIYPMEVLCTQQDRITPSP
jgi:hypothetical protein